jgi:hypothetical protein
MSASPSRVDALLTAAVLLVGYARRVPSNVAMHLQRDACLFEIWLNGTLRVLVQGLRSTRMRRIASVADVCPVEFGRGWWRGHRRRLRA